MIDIGFSWTRGREYEGATESGSIVIRQVGPKKERLEPLKFDARPLYARFAELDGTADACLHFARAWGLLKTPAKQGAFERLEDWRGEIKKLRHLMTMLKATVDPPGGVIHTANFSRRLTKLTSIDVLLLSGKPDERGSNYDRPALVLQPQNLLDAMYLQLAKFVAGDGSLQSCKQCGEWFERGATESRRSIAVFCSEKCKNRFHYLERAKR